MYYTHFKGIFKEDPSEEQEYSGVVTVRGKTLDRVMTLELDSERIEELFRTNFEVISNLEVISFSVLH
jgi:hypothetical protein